MERVIISKVGKYKYGNNYELSFKDEKNNLLNECIIECDDNCSILCGKNCIIICGNKCEIISKSYTSLVCGNECVIDCGIFSKIQCGVSCLINCSDGTLMKVGSNTKMNEITSNKPKIFLKEEEHIWWEVMYRNNNWVYINTYNDENWKKNNYDKYEEFYGFVHTELDSATLF